MKKVITRSLLAFLGIALIMWFFGFQKSTDYLIFFLYGGNSASVIEDFCEKVKQEDFRAAAHFFSREIQSKEGLENIAKALEVSTQSNRFLEFPEQEISYRKMLSDTAQITLEWVKDESEKAKQDFLLIEEGEDWKIILP